MPRRNTQPREATKRQISTRSRTANSSLASNVRHNSNNTTKMRKLNSRILIDFSKIEKDILTRPIFICPKPKERTASSNTATGTKARDENNRTSRHLESNSRRPPPPPPKKPHPSEDFLLKLHHPRTINKELSPPPLSRQPSPPKKRSRKTKKGPAEVTKSKKSEEKLTLSNVDKKTKRKQQTPAIEKDFLTVFESDNRSAPPIDVTSRRVLRSGRRIHLSTGDDKETSKSDRTMENSQVRSKKKELQPSKSSTVPPPKPKKRQSINSRTSLELNHVQNDVQNPTLRGRKGLRELDQNVTCAKGNDQLDMKTVPKYVKNFIERFGNAKVVVEKIDETQIKLSVGSKTSKSSRKPKCTGSAVTDVPSENMSQDVQPDPKPKKRQPKCSKTSTLDENLMPLRPRRKCRDGPKVSLLSPHPSPKKKKTQSTLKSAVPKSKGFRTVKGTMKSRKEARQFLDELRNDLPEKDYCPSPFTYKGKKGQDLFSDLIESTDIDELPITPSSSFIRPMEVSSDQKTPACWSYSGTPKIRPCDDLLLHRMNKWAKEATKKQNYKRISSSSTKKRKSASSEFEFEKVRKVLHLSNTSMTAQEQDEEEDEYFSEDNSFQLAPAPLI